jgi:hypothetical protein
MCQDRLAESRHEHAITSSNLAVVIGRESYGPQLSAATGSFQCHLPVALENSVTNVVNSPGPRLFISSYFARESAAILVPANRYLSWNGVPPGSTTFGTTLVVDLDALEPCPMWSNIEEPEGRAR